MVNTLMQLGNQNQEAIWCNEGAKTCSCGGTHTSAQYNSKGHKTCSGGAKNALMDITITIL